MGIKISHIEVPEEWKATTDYDSHRPLLYLILSNLAYPESFVEYGSGLGSTPLLTKMCAEKNIAFASYDTDIKWCAQTGATFVDDFNNIKPCKNKSYFIDGKPGEQRKYLLQKLADSKILIVHDSEEGAEYVYGLKHILSTFKYRIDYQPPKSPHTTAISNLIDIEKWVSHQE